MATESSIINPKPFWVVEISYDGRVWYPATASIFGSVLMYAEKQFAVNKMGKIAKDFVDKTKWPIVPSLRVAKYGRVVE